MPDPTLDAMAKFSDPNAWDHIERGVPIFVEHEMYEIVGPDGKLVSMPVLPGQTPPPGAKIKYKVDREVLQFITDKINANFHENAKPVKLFIGHTLPPGAAKQEQQPELVGYAINASLSQWGPRGTLGVMVDKYFEKGKFDGKAKDYPERSPEFNPFTGDITAVALLKTEPKLPMGMTMYGWQGNDRIIRYGHGFEAYAMPSDRVSAEKARQILEDGEVRGHELTDAQRKMFGAAAHKYGHEADKPINRKPREPKTPESVNSKVNEGMHSGAYFGDHPAGMDPRTGKHASSQPKKGSWHPYYGSDEGPEEETPVHIDINSHNEKSPAEPITPQDEPDEELSDDDKKKARQYAKYMQSYMSAASATNGNVLGDDDEEEEYAPVWSGSLSKSQRVDVEETAGMKLPRQNVPEPLKTNVTDEKRGTNKTTQLGKKVNSKYGDEEDYAPLDMTRARAKADVLGKHRLKPSDKEPKRSNPQSEHVASPTEQSRESKAGKLADMFHQRREAKGMNYELPAGLRIGEEQTMSTELLQMQYQQDLTNLRSEMETVKKIAEEAAAAAKENQQKYALAESQKQIMVLQQLGYRFKNPDAKAAELAAMNDEQRSKAVADIKEHYERAPVGPLPGGRDFMPISFDHVEGADMPEDDGLTTDESKALIKYAEEHKINPMDEDRWEQAVEAIKARRKKAK